MAHSVGVDLPPSYHALLRTLQDLRAWVREEEHATLLRWDQSVTFHGSRRWIREATEQHLLWLDSVRASLDEAELRLAAVISQCRLILQFESVLADCAAHVVELSDFFASSLTAEYASDDAFSTTTTPTTASVEPLNMGAPAAMPMTDTVDAGKLAVDFRTFGRLPRRSRCSRPSRPAWTHPPRMSVQDCSPTRSEPTPPAPPAPHTHPQHRHQHITALLLFPFCNTAAKAYRLAAPGVRTRHCMAPSG